jgi:hypothetical protein
MIATIIPMVRMVTVTEPAGAFHKNADSGDAILNEYVFDLTS